MVKKSTYVFIILALTLFTCMLQGCADDDPIEETPFVSILVSGGVYDNSTGEAIEGVTVVLKGFDKYDINRTYKPFYRDTTYTSATGEYHFVRIDTVKGKDILTSKIYSVEAIDQSVLREEHYKPMVIDLYLDNSSPSYDERVRSFMLFGNDFHLQK